jgi:hypothetical protein
MKDEAQTLPDDPVLLKKMLLDGKRLGNPRIHYHQLS